MAKQKRKRSSKPKRSALGHQGMSAIKRAAEQVSGKPLRRRPLPLIPDPPRVLEDVLHRRERVPPAKRAVTQAAHPAVLPHQVPRQRRLPQQRPAVRQVLAQEGRHLSARQRKELNEEIPQHLRELICGERKVRRQMVFATKSQGRKGGLRPKQRSIWSDVRC